MPKKMYALSESDTAIISEALADLAAYHFGKMRSLKRESDQLFHQERFHQVTEVRFNFLEQK